MKCDAGLFVGAIVVEVPGRFGAVDDAVHTCVFGAVPFAVVILVELAVVALLRAAISPLDSFRRVAAVVRTVRSLGAKTVVTGRGNEAVLVSHPNVAVFLTAEDVETGRR